MLALARRMLHDPSEAEDVAQEVFLRLWRVAPHWREGGARVETWMHRVALNLCYDRLRRRRETLDPAPLEAALDGAAGAEELLFARQRAEAVRAQIARLPERQRAALVLCVFQEMSNIDAAATMEISVEALESLLARARRRLRIALAHMATEVSGELSGGRQD